MKNFISGSKVRIKNVIERYVGGFFLGWWKMWEILGLGLNLEMGVDDVFLGFFGKFRFKDVKVYKNEFFMILLLMIRLIV